MRTVPNPLATLAALSALALLPDAAASAEPSPSPVPLRHHVTLGIGHAESDDDYDANLHHCSQGQLGYRYSISPILDLALDYRRVRSGYEVPVYDPQVEFYRRMAYFGGGLRIGTNKRMFRPYAQANVYRVRESSKANRFGPAGEPTTTEGTGFGLMGGMEIRLTRVSTIPLEVTYLRAHPGHDVSSTGAQVGITFNFGAMR